MVSRLHWRTVARTAVAGTSPRCGSRTCQQPGIRTVPFIKRLGSVAGRELGAGSKGGDWDRWPEDLKFRGFPAAAEAVAAS